MNIYIVYLWPFKQSVNFTLENSLFGVADLDKYKYSGYGSECDTRGIFSLSDGSGFARNVIIFIADKKIKISLSLHYNGANGYLFFEGV